MGKEENRTTEIPGVSLHQRTAPTPPCRMTYHPGIIVVAQGSKRVNLGRTTFTYDQSRFVVTAVDLPIVSWVALATEKVPCLALSIKFDMSMVRELLSREEIHVAEARSDSPAYVNRQDHAGIPGRMLPPGGSAEQSAGRSFSERPDSTRDHLSRPARARGSELAWSSNTRRSKPPDGGSDCVDSRELCEASARGRARTGGEHGCIHVAPSFQDADRDESTAVSKAASSARGSMDD